MVEGSAKPEDEGGDAEDDGGEGEGEPESDVLFCIDHSDLSGGKVERNLAWRRVGKREVGGLT